MVSSKAEHYRIYPPSLGRFIARQNKRQMPCNQEGIWYKLEQDLLLGSQALIRHY